MTQQQDIMQTLWADWLDRPYVRGKYDCVHFVLAYLDAIGHPYKESDVAYDHKEKLSARRVIKVLGRPLPDGDEGDIVLSEDVLALNPKNGEYVITMVGPAEGRKGGMAMVSLDGERQLQWQVHNG